MDVIRTNQDFVRSRQVLQPFLVRAVYRAIVAHYDLNTVKELERVSDGFHVTPTIEKLNDDRESL